MKHTYTYVQISQMSLHGWHLSAKFYNGDCYNARKQITLLEKKK